MAILLEKEGRNSEAHPYYQRALKASPKHEAKIYHNLGINMKRAGKLEDALSYYQNALDIEPANSVFLYNAAVVHNIKSDYEQAKEMLERSIEFNRENVYAYLALGDALERQKEIKKAIYVYRDLMSLGTKVHGLKEKLTYLEGVQEEIDRKAQQAEKQKLEEEKLQREAELTR